jgi:4-amino-4-deoxy-L-arabinose transferase-like glycosyltransferase
LLLVALTLRLAAALLLPDVDPFLQLDPLHGDARSYDRLARNLALGNGYTERPPHVSGFWPPLYPGFLALLYTVFGHRLLVARMAQALIGAALSLLWYSLSLPLAGRRVAIITGLGVAVYPYLLYFGVWLISETLFMVLLSAALWQTARLPEAGLLAVVPAALLYGLAALTKPTVLFFMPLIAIWLFAAPGHRSFLSRVMPVLGLAAFMLLTILPWSLRNYNVFDEFVLISTNGGYTFLGANNPDAWGGHDEGFPPPIPRLNDAQTERVYYQRAFTWITENPKDFLSLLVPKFRRLLSPLSVASFRHDLPIPGASVIYFVYHLYLSIAFVGMILGLRYWHRLGLLYAPILGVVVSTALYYGDARYTIPMSPSLLFFTALALDRGWHYGSRFIDKGERHGHS